MYIAEAHREARLQFQLWDLAGTPRCGKIFENMCHTKKVFKSSWSGVRTGGASLKGTSCASQK